MTQAFRTILIVLCCSIIGKSQAQSPAFYHLSTAEGLSDNQVNHAVRDRNGMVWIATSEGLNSFDGNRIQTYYKYDNPGLADNSIDRLTVDSANNIWIRTLSPFITLLDTRRTFHKLPVGDTTQRGFVTGLFPTSRGLVAVRGGKHYLLTPGTRQFNRFVTPFDDSVSNTGFTYYINNDRAIYYRNDKMTVADYRLLKKVLEINIPGLGGANYINDDELMAYSSDGSTFYIISISKAKVLREYKNLVRDQDGLPLTGTLRNHTRIDSMRFAFTTYFSGIYIVDLTTMKAEHNVHDPADPRSLGGNNAFLIRYDTSGYLFVTTQSSGLHFRNLRQPQVNTRPYFSDGKQPIFDGFIHFVCTNKSGTIWMGAQDRLIRWNRKSGETSFVPLTLSDGTKLYGNETIRSVLAEENGRCWAGTTRYGLLLLDEQNRIIRHYKEGDKELPSRFINNVAEGMDGGKWVCTLRGLCIIDAQNNVVSLAAHPVLDTLSKIACLSAYRNDKTGITWFATNNGAWRYDEKQNTLKHYSTKEGLAGNIVQEICEDDYHNTYFACWAGLSILDANGQLRTYNLSNGLRHDRCDALVKDRQGFIWIGNLSSILRYDPVRKLFAVYEDGLGFSHGGYRIRTVCISDDGELIWGTDKGLIHFYPEQISGGRLPLHPFIYSLQSEQQRFQFTGNDTLRFPYNTSSFVFGFSSGELGGDRKVQFRCRLMGHDENWTTPAGIGQTVYSNLGPGRYTFEIKASRDGITWYESPNRIMIIVATPWWKTSLFRLAVALLAAGTLLLLIRWVRRRRKLAMIRQTVDYFASSSYEHSSADDIFHDITRNCISRLGFEDCVIYVPDFARNVLVQKAAFGPKNSAANEIVNPLEIPFGKGIVGAVALSGKASLVNDTSADERYIVDDERRWSELTVPVIHEGKLLAVIDSENSRKHFFTKQHLAALQQIGSLCAAKISRSLAVEAMAKSRIELMELNTKMAEAKFLNLRLQMNPHFLFNSLSAIQHLIVSQQTNKAYKYLTVFSNFLRSLLNFADKNFIPLDEEMKVLTMYIELESLRFDQSFHWELTADENLEQDEILVPSLMVQPFAENAIWHGLLHKDGEKNLSIRFSGNEKHLVCRITDNGIGRAKAAAIKESNINSRMRESRGIGIIEERLALLQQKTGKPAKVETEDLYSDDGNPAGTSVTIIIPYYNPEES